MTVGEFCTRKVLMTNKGTRRIPVLNKEGDLEGILAVDDQVELLARPAAQGQALEGL